MKSDIGFVAADRRAAGCAEGASAALLTSLLSSTALASMLFLQASVANAQTVVTVGDGETVSIPSDYDPTSVSRVSVGQNGSLTTNDADISASVTGSGVIVVQNGTAVLNGGSVFNLTTEHGDALRVSGAAATVEATGLALKTTGSFESSAEVSSGAYAFGGATINLMDGSVVTTGDYGYAIRTAGNGSHIGATGIEITTSGYQGIGVQAYGDHNASSATTVSISDSIVSTEGERAFGAQAARIGAQIDATNTSFETLGAEAFGIIVDRGGSVSMTGGSVTTNGNYAHGIFAAHREPFSGSKEGESSVSASGVAVTTRGDHSSGIYARGSAVDLTDVDIVTEGIWSHGVHAEASTFQEGGLAGQPAPATITIVGGSIRTLNDKGQFDQDGDGSRAYAIYAVGEGASVEADGTTIETSGQRAYGAYAVDGATVTLDNTTITTSGFMAYGIYASGAGSEITATNVDITTHGRVGDAAWAYDGGVLNLNGGRFIVNGDPDPGKEDESANGLLAFRNGVIEADGLTIVTRGRDSAGIKAGATLGEGGPRSGGDVTFENGSITVEGENSVAALVRFGSTLEVRNSTLVSQQGAGIATVDSAEVTIENTTVSAAEASISARFTEANQEQTITVASGSVLTENNGTLLEVTREGAGANGELTLELEAGSISAGDVRDSGTDGDGGTDFIVREGAQWSGAFYGIRHFVSESASEVTFGDGSEILGNLTGNGSRYVFGEGVAIGGNLSLDNGSTTAGGSIENPVHVDGDVDVHDISSFFGGNWIIGGNLQVAGTLSPGNSMGKIIVQNDLTLEPTSTYNVEIYANGESDRTDVTNTANLDGSVIVSIGDGVKLLDPYTILTAGSITGTFDSVDWDRQYYFLSDPGLDQSTTSVLLTVSRNGLDFASAAVSANEMAVANAAEDLDENNPVFNTLLQSTNENAARQAFASLSGEVHPSTITVLTEDSRFVREAANARLRAASDGISSDTAGTAERPLTDRFAFWGRAFGSWGDRDGAGNTASVDHTSSGVIFGGDALVSNDLRVGLLAGYGNGNMDIDARRSSANTDSYTLGLYAGKEWQAFTLRLGGTYSWHDVEVRRVVAFNGFTDDVKADYDASTAQVFGEAGYRIGAGAVHFEPYVGIAHVNVATDDFTERGGEAALTARSSNHDTTFTTSGVRAQAASSFGTTELRFRGELGWRHAFGDLSPVSQLSFAGGSTFAIAGAPLARDALVIGAGFDVELAGSAKLELSYDGQVGDGVQQHGVTARLGVQF